jgi:transposase-like protein
VTAILAAVGTGKSLNEAAGAAGITPRTLRRWRRRAWNPDPAAAPNVELEQALHRVTVARAELASRLALDSSQTVAAELDADLLG